jgi:hypothetical protein
MHTEVAYVKGMCEIAIDTSNVNVTATLAIHIEFVRFQELILDALVIHMYSRS